MGRLTPDADARMVWPAKLACRPIVSATVTVQCTVHLPRFVDRSGTLAGLEASCYLKQRESPN